MNTEQEFNTPPRRAYTRRSLLMLGTLTSLALFWQTVLPVILHGCLYALEILEQITDDILESLGVEGYTAQLVTAWLGLTVFIIMTAWAYRKTTRHWDTIQARLQTGLQQHWPSCVLLVSAFLAGTFLL